MPGFFGRHTKVCVILGLPGLGISPGRGDPPAASPRTNRIGRTSPPRRGDLDSESSLDLRSCSSSSKAGMVQLPRPPPCSARPRQRGGGPPGRRRPERLRGRRRRRPQPRQDALRPRRSARSPTPRPSRRRRTSTRCGASTCPARCRRPRWLSRRPARVRPGPARPERRLHRGRQRIVAEREPFVRGTDRGIVGTDPEALVARLGRSQRCA
jgi:hypothetical protein